MNMRRPWWEIVLLAVILTGVGALTKSHHVSVGLFLSPPAPSVSVSVPASGFPLPVYATNDLPEFPPRRTIVFWRNLALNFTSSLVVAALLFSVARWLRLTTAKITS